MRLWMVAVAGCTLVLAACVAALAQQAPALAYDTDGKMLRPADYRSWMYLTTGFDMAYVEGAAPSDHRFDNVFVNREAYDGFVKTGVWPDRTVMVLEIRKGGGDNPLNKRGVFQAGAPLGMEVHVKDAAKGGWSFYGFPAGAASASVTPKTADCYACHEQHAAVDTTFVQFYPTLSAWMPK